MHTATTRLLLAIALTATTALGAGVLAQQPPAGPAERAGRYVLQPTDGGFVRMDTETGQMSVCRQREGNLVCQMAADDRAAMPSEIERLDGEAKRLAAEVRRLEELALADQKGPPRKRAERGLTIPSEEEIDQALDQFERLFKKFRDRMDRLDGDRRGQRL